MMPISDANPRKRFPILVVGLIILNVLVFIWELSLSASGLQEAFVTLSVVPQQFTDAPFSLESWLDIFRSMFFHGGIEHIAGNMLYLWLFGDNVEDRMGIILFLFVYFVSGIAAALAQIAIDPDSTVPLVGASGAIAGILGSYIVLYPNVKVKGLVPLGRTSRMAEWPAWAVLGLWFVLQLVSGIGSLGAEAQGGGGVAFFAHIGGFVLGAIVAGIFVAVTDQPDPQTRRNLLYERKGASPEPS
jgi:membrane associated rhomboid family serine protease